MFNMSDLNLAPAGLHELWVEPSKSNSTMCSASLPSLLPWLFLGFTPVHPLGLKPRPKVQQHLTVLLPCNH